MRAVFLLLLSVAGCTTPPVPAPDASEPVDATTHDAGSDASDAAGEDDAGEDGAVDAEPADAEPIDGALDAAADAAPIECLVVAPTECPDPELVYADIEPIILARCTVCHDGTGAEWPLDTYFHVVDWASDIRTRLLECSMPPPDSGRTIPTAESQLIIDWIRCGMPRTAP